MKTLVDSIAPLYGLSEARAIVRMVLEERFGLSYTRQCMDGISSLSINQRAELDIIMCRLAKGEPVQYVLGTATFCGLTFRVTPATLIPRPETAWLVEDLNDLKVLNDLKDFNNAAAFKVLDIGTGSGCIAIALAKQHPDWHVWACDISEGALAVAKENAKANHVTVDFFQADILTPPQPSPTGEGALSLHSTTQRRTDNDTPSPAGEGWGGVPFSLIVSNPPYVCQSEETEMEPWVLDHEPHQALFVPDSDPLLFYRAIARHAHNLLMPGGVLAFECNTRFADDVAKMLTAQGFRQAQVHPDMFSRPRFVTATL